jgi:hypothetical protein
MTLPLGPAPPPPDQVPALEPSYPLARMIAAFHMSCSAIDSVRLPLE